MTGMLDPYRVLDLTDERAELTSFMLAGLGADVIKVEPPGGSASRHAAPLAAGEPDGMASLNFHAYNRGKRSIELDLDDLDDRARFGELVASADFVIENAGPGVLSARGLGFEELCRHRSDLVYVAISPFGQTGPYADHLATDLTLAAMGGQMALTGDPDRRPVRVSVPQTWHHAAAESALGAMVAHHRRLLSGEAQFVDTSVQAAVFWTGLNAMIRHAIDGQDNNRVGTELHLSTISTPLVYPCADGEVCLIAAGATLTELLPWMHEAGAVDQDWIASEDWETYERRLLAGEPVAVPIEEVRAKITVFAGMHTKAEIFAGALERGQTIVPVNTAADTIAFEHLRVRDYWQNMELRSGATIKAPGAFSKIAGRPVEWARPAPAPGEHTEEILNTLSADGNDRARPAGDKTGRLPLEGVKVADFSWIGVGPITAKSLADHGATVVRIESDSPVDRLRLVGPFKDGEIGINRCQFYGSFNTSKHSLHLNLKHEHGNAIARKMLDWCDIAIDSFTAGTMDRLGLGYEVAAQSNPGIIMASTCLFGQTGPAAQLAGYGYHAAAISGFYEITGWPDRSPGGPWNAYTDTVAPRFLTTVLLSALDHRRRTGEGQYIDHAQMESALHFQAPQLLDVQVSGHSARRNGNHDAERAPHDVFPCQGTDQWCAIAVETDAQWRSLRSVLGDPAWATDTALDTLPGRQSAAETIYNHIADFTARLDPRQLMVMMQDAGVPAGMMQRSSDLLADPQFAHRNFYRPLMHPEMGEVPYEGHQYKIAGYDNGPRFPAPCLGEHTFEVLTEMLGIEIDEAAALLASGACG